LIILIFKRIEGFVLKDWVLTMEFCHWESSSFCRPYMIMLIRGFPLTFCWTCLFQELYSFIVIFNSMVFLVFAGCENCVIDCNCTIECFSEIFFASGARKTGRNPWRRVNQYKLLVFFSLDHSLTFLFDFLRHPLSIHAYWLVLC